MAASPAQQRAFVTLRVAGLDQGETVAIIAGSDIFIPVAALEQAGLHGFTGTRVVANGALYVSLTSLMPGIRYTFDQDALTLDITVAASFLGKITQNLQLAHPANIEYTSDRSAYLNYALNSSTSGGSSASFETGYSWRANTFFDSFSAETGGPVRRGLTYIESDDRLRSLRKIVGDALVHTGEFGGSVFLAGVSASRDFELDPYAVHIPQPSLTGAVTSPAVANIYVNGLLVRKVNLPPGSFNLNNIPVTNGNVTTTVIVTDAFGRVQTLSQPYYSSTDVLLRGTTDFTYAAGLIRQNAFAEGDRYGPAAALAHYRIGVTDALTLGGRFETSAQLLSLGPSADFRLPVGLIHAGAALSRNAGYGGSGFSLGYTYASPHFGFGASLVDQTAHYANVGQSAMAERALSSFAVFATTRLTKRSNVNFEYFRRASRDFGTNSGLSLTDTYALGKYALIFSGSRSFSAMAPPQTGITLTLSYAAGRVNASLTHESASDPATGVSTQTTLRVQDAPRGQYGFGYLANFSRQGPSPVSGTLYERTSIGDANLDVNAGGSSPTIGDLRLSGGLAAIGGGVYLTRPVEGAFALVRVPGIAGMHVAVDNIEAGQTNARGDVLVAGLLPNFGNTIGIDDRDAPLNSSIQSVRKLVAPPNRAGALIVFPVERLRALVGKLSVRAKGTSAIPAFGTLDIRSARFSARSDIGVGGEFYLENVPGGTYAAEIRYQQGSCTFTLEAPFTEKIVANLGTLECVTP